MKKFLSLFLLVLFSVAYGWTQGTESFDNIAGSTSSYSALSWTGDNGTTWSATDSRSDQTITAGNKAICIRQSKGKLTGPLTPEQQAGGVGVISFKAKNTAASSDNKKATTYQFKCGSVTQTVTVPAMGTNTVTVTSPEINSTDATEIEITITAVSGVRVTIDDLSWTAAAKADEPYITVLPVTLEPFVTTKNISIPQKITVAGANLTENITLALSGENSDQFELDTETLAPVQGVVEDMEVIVSYNPTAVGEHSATLTLSSTGASSVVYNLTGTATQPKLDKPITTEASGINTTAFTAMWNAVDNASEYVLNVYRKKGTSEIIYLDETFDMCENEGGNDGKWSGISGTPVFPSDLVTAGWGVTTGYSANRCVRFGTGKGLGSLTLPALSSLSGETDLTLTFRAGAWNSSSESTTLLLDITGGGTLYVSSVEMVKGEFTDYTVGITGATPLTLITFKGQQSSNSRFFLDDIKIFSGGATYTHINGSPFTVSDGTATSFDVTGLTPNANYEYSVIAKAPDFIDSDESDRMAVTTQGVVSVESVDSEANIVIGKSGEILIQISESADVTIYHMTGSILDSRKAVEGEFTVPVSTGIYLVKIGNITKKIIVK